MPQCVESFSLYTAKESEELVGSSRSSDSHWQLMLLKYLSLNESRLADKGNSKLVVKSKLVLMISTQCSDYTYLTKACPNLTTLLSSTFTSLLSIFTLLVSETTSVLVFIDDFFFFFSACHFSQSCLLMYYTKQHEFCFCSLDCELSFAKLNLLKTHHWDIQINLYLIQRIEVALALLFVKFSHRILCI